MEFNAQLLCMELYICIYERSILKKAFSTLPIMIWPTKKWTGHKLPFQHTITPVACIVGAVGGTTPWEIKLAKKLYTKCSCEINCNDFMGLASIH